MGTGRLGTGRLGTGRLGTGRLGTGRLGTGRLGTGRLGTGRLGTGRLGTGRLGTGRLGTGRLGTGRLGTGRLGTKCTRGTFRPVPLDLSFKPVPKIVSKIKKAYVAVAFFSLLVVRYLIVLLFRGVAPFVFRLHFLEGFRFRYRFHPLGHFYLHLGSQ